MNKSQIFGYVLLCNAVISAISYSRMINKQKIIEWDKKNEEEINKIMYDFTKYEVDRAKKDIRKYTNLDTNDEES